MVQHVRQEHGSPATVYSKASVGLRRRGLHRSRKRCGAARQVQKQDIPIRACAYARAGLWRDGRARMLGGSRPSP